MAGGLDLLGGVAVNNFWRGRQEATSEGAWQAHAGTLQRKLDEANQKNVFLVALHDSNNYVLQLALEALQRGDSKSPLLKKDARDALRNRHMAESLRSKGYSFDPASGDVRPL